MATYGFDENKNKIEVLQKSEATSKAETGSLSALTTSNKNNLVAAINELKATVNQINTNIASINSSIGTLNTNYNNLSRKHGTDVSDLYSVIGGVQQESQGMFNDAMKQITDALTLIHRYHG